MTDATTPSTHTVLLFDDDQDFLLQQKLRLEAAGYTVHESSTSEGAVELLETVQPDVVIADLMMEQQDSGFTLCYKIKKARPDIPVIMVTGVARETGLEFDAATEEERSWIKADVVLAKPIRFEQLQKELARLLQE